jgi:hypothetical protein
LVSQAAPSAWLIISSAVNRLSVLFQLPLISGVSAGSILVTLRLQALVNISNAVTAHTNIDFIFICLK